jgi:hypothetical protein
MWIEIFLRRAYGTTDEKQIPKQFTCGAADQRSPCSDHHFGHGCFLRFRLCGRVVDACASDTNKDG